VALIYYFCYDNKTPTGGNRVTYRHVRILNELGFPAAVVHSTRGYVLPGHEVSPPPIVYLPDLGLSDKDILVLPEDFGPSLITAAPGCRKIIFNQNAYYTFQGYSYDSQQLPPYLHSDYIATLVVSEDNKKYLETCFPGINCRRIHISFDQDKYYCDDLASKPRSICFMTRKNPGEVVQVVSALRSRANLLGWKFCPIENRRPDEVAAIMRSSRIYMSFGAPEGISLSNLEAMLAGCRVVGYSGMGCREYFENSLCSEVPFGDIVKFVESVEETALASEHDIDGFIRSVRRSQSYVCEAYSVERERIDLGDFYGSIV
jgi:hypothetical protein